MYNKDKTVEAWKTFVNSGVLLEDLVRPEVARSWVRCRESGLDPWSTDFDAPNIKLLDEKRRRYRHSLSSTAPVMKFLLALLSCNVSLMDGENFVFELLTPMATYPRTFGTFMHESRVGTGNATVVSYERKPVRLDGFEQYRAIAQSYSGVSAPYLDAEGNYFGALNLNSPFEMLPESALDLCTTAVRLSDDLHLAKQRAVTLLSTVEFYRPLLMLYERPTLLIDMRGHILMANAPMNEYCPGWQEFSYGSQSLDDYLGKESSTGRILGLPEKLEEPVPVTFRKPRTRSEKTLSLLRRGLVDVDGTEPFYVCVFDEGVVERTVAKSSPSISDRVVTAKGCIDSRIDYIGESQAWKSVDAMVKKVASVNANVLLLGETGAGKEVVARALHRHSGRQGEFVPINCGAIPRDLLATELFGYETGAFTGAREGGAIGKFEYANGGTLFLDEIGEMPVDMQVTLLRVLQDQSVTKLGSNTSRPLDVRVIAATNQNITELIDEKKFRSDLYYRLSLVEIALPPLRARPDDVPLLVEFFNEGLSCMLNMPCMPFPDETLQMLMRYSWPGNVRELRNFVERSLIMQGGGANVTAESLPPYMASGRSGVHNIGPLGAVGSASWEAPVVSGPAGASTTADDSRPDPVADMSAHIPDHGGGMTDYGDHAITDETDGGRDGRRSEEKRRIIEVLERDGGNISVAAEELGISRKTLYRRLEELHLRICVVVEDY